MIWWVTKWVNFQNSFTSISDHIRKRQHDPSLRIIQQNNGACQKTYYVPSWVAAPMTNHMDSCRVKTMPAGSPGLMVVLFWKLKGENLSKNVIKQPVRTIAHAMPSQTHLREIKKTQGTGGVWKYWNLTRICGSHDCSPRCYPYI